MTARRILALSGLLLAGALSLGACGGSDSSSSEARQPVARASDFPMPNGKTMLQLRRTLPPGPVLAPTVSVLQPGVNRFGFGLFDRTRKQISEAPVVVYVEKSGSTKVGGPFPARGMPLDVAPPYQSETVAKDPNAAKSLYVSRVRFPDAGVYAVMGVAKLDGRLVATDPMPVKVSASDSVPRVGQKAPVIDTPTVASAKGNVASIDTRTPPDDMHDVSFADVAGKKPAILLFATPALCQSRVCGPVVDIAEEVKAERGKDAAFIHQEIYRNNTIAQGCFEGTRPIARCLRPQVVAYHLETEPWLFAVDRKGRIAARLEGAFSKSELEDAVDAATGKR